MPKLHHWADLAFIAYQHQCGVEGQSVKRLKNVFRCDIKNEITHAIIGAILPDRPERSTVDFFTFRIELQGGKGVDCYAEWRRRGVDVAGSQEAAWVEDHCPSDCNDGRGLSRRGGFQVSETAFLVWAG